MLHRNAARRALEKGTGAASKREGRMEARALAEKEGAWKAKLEKKFRESVYLLGAGVLQSVCPGL